MLTCLFKQSKLATIFANFLRFQLNIKAQENLKKYFWGKIHLVLVAHAVADPELQIREGGTDSPDPSPRSATAHVRQLLQYIHFTHLVQPTLVSKTWAEVKNRIMYSICVHQRLRLKPKVRILTLAQYCRWDSRESNLSSTVSSNTFKHQP